MSKNDIIIGIDLGTTTSEACIINQKKRKKMMVDGAGNDIISSVVGIDPKTKKLVVGERAASGANGQTKYFITEVKREMGKQKKLTLGDQKLTPSEVSAEILKYIKSYSEDMLGEKINKAVISVPANFNNNQRVATKEAGELAGFTVERLINEPTAAALAYCMDNTEKDFVKVMIYDLGGGTFDVSIGEFKGGLNVLDVLSSAGNMHLGGKDFDRLLSENIFEEFEKEYGIDLRNEDDTNYRVTIAAETAKKELSFSGNTTVNLPFLATKDGKPISYEKDITREEFESLITEKIDETAKAIDKALKGAKLKKEDMDMILLVGGSTRIPYVQKFVEKYMGKKPKKDVDPDRVVSIGAAHQAAIIAGGGGTVMDVTSLSLGTTVVANINGQLVPGFYDEILPAQTKHLKPLSKTYHTIKDDQPSVSIEVYQKNDVENDSMWAADQEFLYKDSLSGIPKGKAGQEAITITYCYNPNGMLDVKAVIDSTGKEKIFRVGVDKETSKMKGKKKIEGPSKTKLIEWKNSSLAKEYKTTINIAEKRLKDKSHKKMEGLLNDLKTAIIDEDKNKADDISDKINDLLFDLEN